MPSHAEERGRVADAVGLGQDQRSFGVVDGQEHQVGAGILGTR